MIHSFFEFCIEYRFNNSVIGNISSKWKSIRRGVSPREKGRRRDFPSHKYGSNAERRLEKRRLCVEHAEGCSLQAVCATADALSDSRNSRYIFRVLFGKLQQS